MHLRLLFLQIILKGFDLVLDEGAAGREQQNHTGNDGCDL